MTEPKSPLDALLARVGRLLEGTAGAGVADQVQQVIADFLAAFRLVPKRDFDSQIKALEDLEAQVAELSRRVQALESDNESSND